MKRMSGDWEARCWWWRVPLAEVEEEEEAGEGEEEGEGDGSMVLGAYSVVLRCRCVVSALGGGGREMVVVVVERAGLVGSREARQRKHSPVP